jgi:hypothetical protein
MLMSLEIEQDEQVAAGVFEIRFMDLGLGQMPEKR